MAVRLRAVARRVTLVTRVPWGGAEPPRHTACSARPLNEIARLGALVRVESGEGGGKRAC